MVLPLTHHVLGEEAAVVLSLLILKDDGKVIVSLYPQVQAELETVAGTQQTLVALVVKQL